MLLEIFLWDWEYSTFTSNQSNLVYKCTEFIKLGKTGV